MSNPPALSNALEYVSIDAYARHLAAEHDTPLVGRFYDMIVSAIWAGEFERDGDSAVHFPKAGTRFLRSGTIQNADGSWRAILRPTFASSIEAAPPKPHKDTEWNREDLRQALKVSAEPDDSCMNFHQLAGFETGRWGNDFKATYFDELVIETRALEQWAKVHFSQPEQPSGEKRGPKSKSENSVTRAPSLPGRPAGTGKWDVLDSELLAVAMSIRDDQGGSKASAIQCGLNDRGLAAGYVEAGADLSTQKGLNAINSRMYSKWKNWEN